jgi:UPF0755 protein
MRKKAAFLIVVGIGFALVVAAVVSLRWVLSYPDRPLDGPARPVTVTIPQGATFSDVLDNLQKLGLVKRPFFFRVWANGSGLAGRLKPGTYTVAPGTTPRKLLETMVKGPKVVLLKVTIPEGKHLLEVAQLIAAAGIGKEPELVEKARSRSLAKKLEIPGESLEGYLYPDTYLFRPDSTPELVFGTLVKRHKAVMRELKARHPSHMIRLRNRFRFDDHQITIMASLVEKETGVKSERPLIAGVFLNRLSLPTFPTRKLETDPTIIYGCTVPLRKSDACRQFAGRIRRIHLDDAENLYNTYQHAGLPPGPICNPGKAALQAVIQPTPSKYIYFVSKNDGSHHFSATFAEHNEMVNKYQRGGGSAPAPAMSVGQ